MVPASEPIPFNLSALSGSSWANSLRCFILRRATWAPPTATKSNEAATPAATLEEESGSSTAAVLDDLATGGPTGGPMGATTGTPTGAGVGAGTGAGVGEGTGAGVGEFTGAAVGEGTGAGVGEGTGAGVSSKTFPATGGWTTGCVTGCATGCETGGSVFPRSAAARPIFRRTKAVDRTLIFNFVSFQSINMNYHKVCDRGVWIVFCVLEAPVQ